MGQGKDLYEENRRLRQQLDDANNRYFEKRDAENAKREALLELGLSAIEAFLTGKAALVSTVGNDPESRIMYFQMPPKAAE